MAIAHFVKVKAEQLVFYVRGFWKGNIPYQEIHLFIWDTLEEWNQMRCSAKSPVSEREQVFWHLVHQIHAWSPDNLLKNMSLREELDVCIDFLENGGFKPFQCVGIRP